MKVIAHTINKIHGDVCKIYYPNYRNRNKILVSEPVTRQETDEEFLTRLEIPFKSKSEMTGLIAALNPKRYKKKQIEVEPAVYRDETDDEILQRAIDSLPADAQHITVIEHTDLPYDGYRPELRTRSVVMRNSWVNPPDTTSPPMVDMVKAREGKMAEWRKKRADLFDVLDKQEQIATRNRRQDEVDAIHRDKNALQDFPVTYADRIAAFTDPEELDNFDPVIDIIIQMESI